MLNSKKIKGRMVELGLTQSDLAKKVGITQPTLSQKINNLRPTTVNEAYDMQQALKIPDEEFGLYFFAC